MKLIKITARFGKLSGESLELKSGLNIITAPNESGKSTWCAFIRAMLYGIDTAQRKSAGSVTEKAAANPWSGHSPEGSMDIEYEGKKLTLRRSTASPNAPMRRFSAVYSGTEDPFPLSGTDCGETLTGVNREVFIRSAFVSQGSAGIDNSPELEKRMNAIVSTGSDKMSFSDADEKLRAWQRERCYNAKVGMNARLQETLSETESRLRAVKSAYEEALRLREEIAALERVPMPDDCLDLSEKLTAAEELERETRRQLDLSPFGARDSREINLELSRERQNCQALLEKSRQRYSYSKLIAPAALLIFTLVLAYLGFAEWKVAAFPIGLFLILLLISSFNGAAVLKSARDAAASRRRILRKYGIDDESGFDELERAHREKSDAWIRARDEMLSLRRSLDSRRLSRFSDPLVSRREKLASVEGRLSVLGNAEELLSAREHLRQCIDDNLYQKQCIDLAREMLQEASRKHLSEFSPRLTRLTQEYFCKVTKGRYSQLSLDSSLNISARLCEDTLPRGSEHMSEGARQLLYLCLRLAICVLSLPEEKNVPLVLDDALCTLDDERCFSFLELLWELSKDRQIILFTCHSREANYLRGRDGVWAPEVQ